MPSVSATRRKWRLGLSGGLVLVVLGATATLGLSLLEQHKANRVQEVARIVEVLKGFTGGMAETADRSLSAIDMIMGEMKGALSILRDNGDHWQNWTADHGYEFLHARITRSGMPQVRDFALFDHTGKQLFHSSLKTAPSISIQDRPYFKEIIGGASDASWGPYKGRNTGNYTFAIAHRLEDSVKGFSGVLFAAVEPDYFQVVCNQLRPDAAMSGLFVNRDGIIIAACNGLDQIDMPAVKVIGQDTLDITGSNPSYDALASAKTIIFHRQLQGHPGISVIGTASTALLLSNWRELERQYITLAGGSISALILAGLGLAAYLSLSVQREEYLQRTNEHLKATDASKSRFLATMSHELRTPLNSIIGFTDLVSSEGFGPIGDSQYLEHAGYAGSSAHHLLTLINSILDYSKIESGTMKLEPMRLQVETVVKASAHMLRNMAHTAGVSLLVDAQPDMPEILADERAMRQILINIISNAIKFNSNGGSVSIVASTASNAINIVISDTGAGIPNEEIERIMRPFEQLDNKYSRTRDGTGLGLSIVEGLIRLHGGSIAIASEVGKGTDVTIRLPKAPEPSIGPTEPAYVS